jgi:hypothetical protein
VVPSWNTVEDIAVSPFKLGKIKLPYFIVLLLRVPATIDVDLMARLVILSKD